MGNLAFMPERLGIKGPVVQNSRSGDVQDSSFGTGGDQSTASLCAKVSTSLGARQGRVLELGIKHLSSMIPLHSFVAASIDDRKDAVFNVGS